MFRSLSSFATDPRRFRFGDLRWTTNDGFLGRLCSSANHGAGFRYETADGRLDRRNSRNGVAAPGAKRWALPEQFRDSYLASMVPKWDLNDLSQTDQWLD